MFVADSGYTSHMMNSLKNMTNLREVKTSVKTGNKKTITGSLQGNWKLYQKIYGRLYSALCNNTAYIPDLSVDISM